MLKHRLRICIECYAKLDRSELTQIVVGIKHTTDLAVGKAFEETIHHNLRTRTWTAARGIGVPQTNIRQVYRDFLLMRRTVFIAWHFRISSILNMPSARWSTLVFQSLTSRISYLRFFRAVDWQWRTYHLVTENLRPLPHRFTVGNKIIRALEIIRVKRLIPNTLL